ncbi:hypothetical protein AB2N08_21275 [Massilia aurea]|uniref:hypothetical protein n=1 Tax=Massilia aurea TaxID=373040 RepID=UPI0034621AF4
MRMVLIVKQNLYRATFGRVGTLEKNFNFFLQSALKFPANRPITILDRRRSAENNAKNFQIALKSAAWLPLMDEQVGKPGQKFFENMFKLTLKLLSRLPIKIKTAIAE